MSSKDQTSKDNNPASNIPVVKNRPHHPPKDRISKIAKCIRKTSASIRIPQTLMPDSAKFNAKRISPDMSSKFTEVIKNIQMLDNEDKANHGTLYKHFIFTDIRESAFGAKALASFMIASGYNFQMESVRDKTVYKHSQSEPGGGNGFAMLQSLPLWKKPLSAFTKREILKVFNSRPENVNGELLRIIILDSKYKEGIDLFDVKYVHLLEPAIAPSDLKQAVGRATRFCGQKGLPFAPRRGWKLNVYIYSSILPTRKPFIMSDSLGDKPLDAHAFMLAHSGLDLALLNLTKELTMLGIISSVDYDLNYKINNFNIESAVMDAVEDVDERLIVEVDQSASVTGGEKIIDVYRPEDVDESIIYKCANGRKSKLFPFTKVVMHQVARDLGLKFPKSSKKGVYCNLLRSNPQYRSKLFASKPFPNSDKLPGDNGDVIVRQLTPENHFESPLVASASPATSMTSLTSMRRNTPNPIENLSHLPFDDFQKAVLDLYGKYKWNSPIVKSGCDNTQFGKPGSAVSFTQTQDFIRHYLTPDSPFKGLLAWHSVGTGKTCMAVAAATSQFEKAGYTILWVTRNALMADVYKNIFGSVCSIPIMEQLEKGETIPDTLTQQKRMLSRSWMAPISYRTFQNALEEKNELGRLLHKNNPTDPLRNTFLIMDEIHKLQDGDLSSAESANFELIQDFIFDSYATSKSNSVRPLLMTATPITDNPKELFEIINTLIPVKERRLMSFNEFRETYTSPIGEISEDGKLYFKDRAKGLISYLNREFDPTTFSQPVFNTVSVPISGSEYSVPTPADVADACVRTMDVDVSELGDMTDCSGAVVAEESKAMELINSQQLLPKEHSKALKELAKTMKRVKKECESKNRSMKKTIRQISKNASKCYRQQFDEYAETYGKSQAAAVGSCLVGKTSKKALKDTFADKDQVIQNITRKLIPASTTNESHSKK